jgi:hypothetical protein
LQLLVLDTVGAPRPAGLARCRSGRPCTCRSGTASQPPRRVRWQTHRTRSAPPSLPSHQPGPVQQATGQPGQLATPPAGRNGQPSPLVRPQQAGVLCRPPSTGSKHRRDAGAWRFSRTTLSGEQGRRRLPLQAARPQVNPRRGRADASIARSAPPGAAAPLPRRGSMHPQALPESGTTEELKATRQR